MLCQDGEVTAVMIHYQLPVKTNTSLSSSYCLIFLLSQQLYTSLTQPKVLANKTFCSSSGYILNFYALFATVSLPSSVVLSLTFYIFFYNFYRCTTCCQQTKALTPESLLPQFLTYLREFLFQQSAACTFIGIYEHQV